MDRYVSRHILQDVQDELVVFVASDIEEFRNVRARLKWEIEEMGFARAVVMELEGARPRSVLVESLEAVRMSGIVVFLFGEKFSKITKMEYRETDARGKPCFVYALPIKRDYRLQRFIDEEIRSPVIYSEFTTTDELITTIKVDLRRFRKKLFHEALKSWQAKRRRERRRQHAEEIGGRLTL